MAAPLSGAELISLVSSLVEQRLPPRWSSTLDAGLLAGWGAGDLIDGVLVVRSPSGERLQVALEVKTRVAPRDVPGLLQRLERVSDGHGSPMTPMIAAPYLTPSVRAALEEAGASYVDATGNLRLIADEPAIYVKDRGADSDPWRGPGRPRGTLKGVPAARVVRALVDLAAPMTMRALVDRSGSSTGATYRVVDFLDQEALLTRGPRGEVDSVDWPRLLRRWSQDYAFSADHRVTRFLQPRGLPVLVRDLPRLDGLMDYAVTGSLAAHLWAPYAESRAAMVYVEDVPRAADLLGLRQVEAGTNVLLAAPASSAVFERSTTVDGVRYAAPSQVVADLLTGSGRNPSEGEELLTWMEHHESEWRA